MPVFETYSERKRRAERGEVPDAYQYDQASPKLRVQIRHILDAALGEYDIDVGRYVGYRSTHKRKPNNNMFLKGLHHELLKATGRMVLSDDTNRSNPKRDILQAITDSLSSLDEWLDVVELYLVQLNICVLGRRSYGGIAA